MSPQGEMSININKLLRKPFRPFYGSKQALHVKVTYINCDCLSDCKN